MSLASRATYVLKCLFTVVFRTFWHVHVKVLCSNSLVVKGAMLLGLKDSILVLWQLLDSYFFFSAILNKRRFCGIENMSCQTNFNSAWLQEELFKPWLGTVEKDNHKDRCIVCGLTFELSNMGKHALISHSKGKKHVEKMKYASKMKQQQQQLKSFFVPKSKGTQSTDTTWTEDL